jgi:hypothetical protein
MSNREEIRRSMEKAYGGEAAGTSIRDERFNKLKEAYNRGEKLKPASLVELGIYLAEEKRSQKNNQEESE